MNKRFFAVILLLPLYYMATAQPNMTLYQMHDITQSNTLNPAVAIPCGWVVSFPGLGSISAGIGTPISYNNLGAGNDTMNVDKILSKIHNRNKISTSGAVNLVTIGYRAERTFFQFTVNERFSQVSSISKDPVELLLKGNAGYVGKTVDASPSINALYYREYAFNVAHELNESLWVGARAKLFFGRLSLQTKKSTADLYTDPGTYNLILTSDLDIQASAAGSPNFDANGKVNGFDSDISAGDLIFNPSNIGAGIDLGIIKNFDNNLQLSASILNLGFIGWGKNVHNFTQKGTLTFNGPFSEINELDALVDTVKSFLHLDYAEKSYTQVLAPLLMAGVNYPVHEFINLGVTGMAEFQSNSIPWALTATGFTKGLPFVDLGLSYTVTPSSLFNVGFGIGAHLGPVDIHFLADNIMGAFKPFDATYATLQLGISFRFGCNKGENRENNSKYKALPCPALASPYERARKK